MTHYCIGQGWLSSANQGRQWMCGWLWRWYRRRRTRAECAGLWWASATTSRATDASARSSATCSARHVASRSTGATSTAPTCGASITLWMSTARLRVSPRLFPDVQWGVDCVGLPWEMIVECSLGHSRVCWLSWLSGQTAALSSLSGFSFQQSLSMSVRLSGLLF